MVSLSIVVLDMLLIQLQLLITDKHNWYNTVAEINIHTTQGSMTVNSKTLYDKAA